MIAIFIIPIAILTCAITYNWMSLYCQYRHSLTRFSYRAALAEQRRRERRQRHTNSTEGDCKKVRKVQIRKALNVQKVTEPIQLILQEHTCLICLSNFEVGEKICNARDVDDCVHMFHEPCLRKWLMMHDECPCCRRFIITPEDDVPDTTEHNRGVRSSVAIRDEQGRSTSSDGGGQGPSSRTEHWHINVARSAEEQV